MFVIFLSVIFAPVGQGRNQGCGMLILVDDTFFKLVNRNQNQLSQKIDAYISKLNQIYQKTILKDPPNDNLYFYVKHVTLLENFLPGCENKGVSSIYRVSCKKDIFGTP